MVQEGRLPRAKKCFGQNCLVQPQIVERIVAAIRPVPGDQLVEIGPGPGALTRALLRLLPQLTVVELDRDMIAGLRALAPPEQLEVMQADALEVDFAALAGAGNILRVVGNLPYNVATPLVVHVLEEAPQVESLLVMVQREVGERLAAGVGDTAYGAVSVKVAYWGRAAVVGRVPATVFVPRPRVESVLVRIERRPAPPVASSDGAVAYDQVFDLVRAGFAHRRKMLRRSLEGRAGPGAFDAAGIPPTARAEELALEEWIRLAVAVGGSA